MHAGQNTKMKRGVIWACAIPMGLGVIAATLFVTGVVQWTPNRGGLYWRYLPPEWLLAYGLILVPPLSAWLTCRSLAKIESVEKISRWKSLAGRVLLSAAFVQLFLTALYAFVIYASSVNRAILVVESIIFGWFVKNLICWIFITLPLSLICATIFWRVTKFPEDTSVF